MSAFIPVFDNLPEDLARWRLEFLREKIDPIILPKARELVQRHREAGDRIVLASSTTQYLAHCAAEAWGLEPDSRLSCQAKVTERDLVVEIPKYTINMVSENH